MKIRKRSVNNRHLISKYLPAHYADSFECTFISSKTITPDEIQLSFWTNQPAWVEFLFNVRNTLVKPFKLKSGSGNYHEELKQCLNGKPSQHINIAAKSEDETVLTMIDKHLTFYLSIHVNEGENQQKIITATTLVNFHNMLGRCYFIAIYPFHHIIVRNMLKYIVKKRWL